MDIDGEVPKRHRFNLVPTVATGVTQLEEQIWIIKVLITEAAGGVASEAEKILNNYSLYELNELITLQRAVNYK